MSVMRTRGWGLPTAQRGRLGRHPGSQACIPTVPTLLEGRPSPTRTPNPHQASMAAHDLRVPWLDAIGARPLPGRRQLQGATAVRSRRLRCRRVDRGLNPSRRAPRSLADVESAQEGDGQVSTPNQVDPEPSLPVLSSGRTSSLFAGPSGWAHRRHADGHPASALARATDPDARPAAAARPGSARRAGPGPAADHLIRTPEGARLTAARGATFRCSRPRPRGASRTRGRRRRGT